MFEGEIWRDVDGFNGIYAVSDRGRVKRLTGYRNATWPGRLVKATLTAGYPMVRLWNRTETRAYVHHLVALAFLGPRPSPRHVINHKDRNKTNNTIGNIEWTTPGGNVWHSHHTGEPRRWKSRGEAHGNARLTDAQVAYVLASAMQGRALARELGVSESLISLIRRGKHRNHPL